MKILAQLLALTLWVGICHADDALPTAESRPKLKQEGNKLLVTHRGVERQISGVYDDPIYTWNPDDLLSPDGTKLLVPLENSTYAFYTFRDDAMELESTFEGGVASGGGGLLARQKALDVRQMGRC